MDRTKRGTRAFTLLEMLIVVAIIAILVAISIPTFTGALEKARVAVCSANRRSLKAVLSTALMLSEDVDATFEAEKGQYVCPSGGAISYAIDAASGEIAVACSIHGVELGTGGTGGGISGTISTLTGSFSSLKDFYTTYWPNGTYKNHAIDSGAITPGDGSETRADAYYATLSAQEKAVMDNYTWRIETMGSKDVRVYFTPKKDFDATLPGEKLGICYKYDPDTGKYQYSMGATVEIGKNGNTVLGYNVIKGGGVWGAVNAEGKFESGAWMDSLPEDLNDPLGEHANG